MCKPLAASMFLLCCLLPECFLIFVFLPSPHFKSVCPVEQPAAVCGRSQLAVDQSVLQGSSADPGPGQSILPFARQ